MTDSDVLFGRKLIYCNSIPPTLHKKNGYTLEKIIHSNPEISVKIQATLKQTERLDANNSYSRVAPSEMEYRIIKIFLTIYYYISDFFWRCKCEASM